MRLIIKQNTSDESKQPQHSKLDVTDAHGNHQVKQHVHLLPCKIRPRKSNKKIQTFTAPVDKYFYPFPKVEANDTINKNDLVSGSKLWHASLRGKPLTGVQLTMPVGYVGLFCKKVGETDQEENTNLIADHSNVTQQLMFWNWDRVPTREDPLLAAFDWVHVSEAMMSNCN